MCSFKVEFCELHFFFTGTNSISMEACMKYRRINLSHLCFLGQQNHLLTLKRSTYFSK